MEDDDDEYVVPRARTIVPPPPPPPLPRVKDDALAVATREFASTVTRLRSDLEAAHTQRERDAAQHTQDVEEIARLRGALHWNDVRADMDDASALAASMPTALVRYMADVVARATFAELRLEQSKRVHAVEMLRARTDSDARIAELDAYVDACRREVREMRAAHGDAQRLEVLRADIGHLETRRAHLDQMVRGLSGQITGFIATGLKDTMRAEVCAQVRDEILTETRAEALAAGNEALRQARADVDAAHRDALSAQHQVRQYQNDMARVAVASEEITRRKCAGDLAVYRRQIEHTLGSSVKSVAARRASPPTPKAPP